jgi:hypothetical protein
MANLLAGLFVGKGSLLQKSLCCGRLSRRGVSHVCWLLLADADSMLAAGGFYKGTTVQLEENLSMIILSGLDLWATISPMLTPWWQQGVASLRALLKRCGASR